MRRLLITALAPAACAALVACDDTGVTDTADRAPDTVRAQAAPAPAAAEELEPLDAPLVLAEFEGYADPTTGTMHIERIEGADIRAQVAQRRAAHGLVTVEQSLPAPDWCTGTIRVDTNPMTNPPNSFQLYTIPGSIAAATPGEDIPAACQHGQQALYGVDGVFCAAVEVKNFYADTWKDVHAQLYVFGGDAANQYPYTHPLGTGAPDPGNLPAPGAEIGLWSYGDVVGGGAVGSTVVWTFRNGNGSQMRFRGRVIAHLDEIDNGLDDDCDGVIDDELREFPAGEACTDPLDCVSFLCSGGTCQQGCADGMYGASCADCPGGIGPDQCFGNGSCSDGPSGDGSCTCDAGFHPTADCEVSCSDGIQNGDETGEDCGGATCAACGGILPPGADDDPRLALGYGVAAALLGNGTVAFAPGSDGFGYLNITSPWVPNVGTFTSVDMMWRDICASRSDGQVECRGGSLIANFLPGAVQPNGAKVWNPAIGPLVEVETGEGHVCALGVSGQVVCAGVCSQGQCSRTVPVTPGTVFVDIDAGAYHTCGLLNTGAIECWGSSAGFSGVGLWTASGGGSFESVRAGFYYTCALRTDGATECIGSESGAYFGLSGTFTQMDAGYQGTVGLRADGTIQSVGCGLNAPLTPGLSPFIVAESGAYQACAVTQAGEVQCRYCSGQVAGAPASWVPGF